MEHQFSSIGIIWCVFLWGLDRLFRLNHFFHSTNPAPKVTSRKKNLKLDGFADELNEIGAAARFQFCGISVY